MKWEVTGVWKADGSNGSLVVESPNQRSAEADAAMRGLLVEQAIPVQTAPPAVPQQVVYVQQAAFNPGVAAVLSFFIPGLGQIYKGQIFNGLVWLVVVTIGYICLIVPGLILHVVCIVGAASSKR